MTVFIDYVTASTERQAAGENDGDDSISSLSRDKS